ncbi:hypothetical protein ACFE04_024486 [Oxalis oulophora]
MEYLFCHGKKVTVSAPKLTSFESEIDTFFCCGELVLENTTSIQLVDFHMAERCHCPEIPSKRLQVDNLPMILNIFKGLSSVKSLCLSLDTIRKLEIAVGILQECKVYSKRLAETSNCRISFLIPGRE